jgi:hypothetical protein
MVRIFRLMLVLLYIYIYIYKVLLYIYINSTNIPPIMIINRIYEHQNLLSLWLVSFLVGLRTYQHPVMLRRKRYLVAHFMKRLNGVCIEHRHTDCTHFPHNAQTTLSSVRHSSLYDYCFRASWGSLSLSPSATQPIVGVYFTAPIAL